MGLKHPSRVRIPLSPPLILYKTKRYIADAPITHNLSHKRANARKRRNEKADHPAAWGSVVAPIEATARGEPVEQREGSRMAAPRRSRRRGVAESHRNRCPNNVGIRILQHRFRHPRQHRSTVGRSASLGSWSPLHRVELLQNPLLSGIFLAKARCMHADLVRYQPVPRHR